MKSATLRNDLEMHLPKASPYVVPTDVPHVENFYRNSYNKFGNIRSLVIEDGRS